MGKMIYNGVDCGGSVSKANQVNFDDKNAQLGVNNIQDAVEVIVDKSNVLSNNFDEVNANLDKKTYIRTQSCDMNITSYADMFSEQCVSPVEYYGYSDSGAINGAPTNSNGLMVVSKVNASYSIITAYPFVGGIYVKHKQNGTWGEWQDFALNSDLKVIDRSSEITVNSSIGVINCFAYQYGKIAKVDIIMDVTSILADGTVLATLPSDLTNVTHHAHGYLVDDAYNNCGRIAVTQGTAVLKVYYSSGIKVGKQMRANLIYFIA